MDEHRLASHLAGGGSGSIRGWRCPSEEQLAGFVDAQLSERERRKVQHHLANCDACTRQVAALSQMQDAPVAAPAAALLARARALAGDRRGAMRPLTLGWSAAAAVVATFLLGYVLWPYRPAEPPPATVARIPAPSEPAPLPPVIMQPPVERQEAPTVRSRTPAPLAPTVLFPVPDLAVDRSALEFRWQAIPQTLYYEARIITDSGDLVWEARTESNRLRPPAQLHLGAGEKYFFRVTAYLAGGTAVGTPASAFRLKPAEPSSR